MITKYEGSDRFMTERDDPYGMTSPGGFVFGVSGCVWGQPVPRTITFFLDNTAKVSDQYGRPIKGTVGEDGREVRFAAAPATQDEAPGSRTKLATHVQVIAALEAERVDWQRLVSAGWPQLPYGELKKIKKLPPTPLEELAKIPDPGLRRDALRARRELDEIAAKELGVVT